jgi:NAD(P)-dependent dehydrogenase (short-subunit alcohol dehydrogenase family)
MGVVRCVKRVELLSVILLFRYVYCKECDLASQKSIRDFVDAFKKKESRIDALINNAGIYHAPRSVSMDGIEIHFAVNHLGHFLLTSLLTDIIKSSGPGSRIVFLMNLDYRKGNVVLEDLNFQQRVYNKSDAFYQSQLANMLLVKELARRLSGN